ncbi:MAG: hypothetical protein AAFZ99_02280 [Pseudomonadota bacterium]
MIAWSELWRVQADPQKAAKPEITDSLAENKGQQAFEAEQQSIADMLALDAETSIMERSDIYAPRLSLQTVMIRLNALSDEDVLRVLTFLMADSLSVQSPLIDGLAGMLGTDMAQHWQPEDTFFELIRDKQVPNAMIGELAGETVAKANLTETAKTQRIILGDCLNGTRTPVDASWMPRYMAFPQGEYVPSTSDDVPNCNTSEVTDEKDAA